MQDGSSSGECLSFGPAAFKIAARDQFIGWTHERRQERLFWLVNNDRFLLLPWVQVQGLASWVLSQCLGRLRADWQAVYHHDLALRKNGETTLVQCKRWKTYKVGVQPVRELFGGMAAERADRGIFITSGNYTQEAIRFAEGKPIELVDGAQLAEMLRRFQSSLRRQSGTEAEPILAPHEIPARPTCPRCGSEMVLRRAKHGANAGKEFWGCSAYPKCSGIRQVV